MGSGSRRRWELEQALVAACVDRVRRALQGNVPFERLVPTIAMAVKGSGRAVIEEDGVTITFDLKGVIEEVSEHFQTLSEELTKGKT